nr:uncharacterized protein LOC113704498 [Coffea arabica]
MPTGRLAKWQMILSEFDIVFTSQKAVKGQAIADHLAKNPKDDDYQPLHTYFPDEKVLFVDVIEDMSEQCPEWRLFFDGAANSFGIGIGAVLVSPEGRHYPGASKLQFACMNNMAEYEACIFGLKMALEMEVKELIAFSDSDLLVHQTLKQWVTKDSKILPYHCNLLNLAKQFQSLEFRHLLRARNAFADALATLSSMIQYPDELGMEPIRIQLQDKPAHCWVIDKTSGNSPWYNDIKEFIKTGSYPPEASANDKGFLRRMASKFFLNGEILYKRTSYLNLLRCIDEVEAQYMMKEVHSGVCGSHMNGHLLAKKIMRTGFVGSGLGCSGCNWWRWKLDGNWLVLENAEGSLLTGSHKYFTKWVEAESFKHVTKKVVANFLRDHIICRFGVPETLITDNAKNLNNDMVDGLCEQFKIRHRNSAIYRPQMNGAVEAANKNLKKIIRKMTEKHRDWHEKLPYALMAYQTSIRTSTGATPYSLMYGMEAVLPAEVEIPSLHILMETKLEEADWIKQRHEQLSLIDEKRFNAICHGQCYQKRMARAYNKKVHLRTFEEGDKVLKRILPVQDEAKGKFAPNWQGPFIVQKIPSYAQFLKDIMSKKRKLVDNETIILIEECASVSLIPLSIARKLWLIELKTTNITLQLTDRTIKYLIEVLENVLMKIEKLIIPVDFVILDMEEDMNMPIILGRPFLATVGTLFDVQEDKLLFGVNGKTIVFNLSNGKCIHSTNSSSEDSQVAMVTHEMELKEEKVPPTIIKGSPGAISIKKVEYFSSFHSGIGDSLSEFENG